MFKSLNSRKEAKYLEILNDEITSSWSLILLNKFKQWKFKQCPDHLQAGLKSLITSISLKEGYGQ